MGDNATLLLTFPREQAARLTWLTVGQLQYWFKTGFFRPSIAMSGAGEPHVTLYTFRDLRALRVLGKLRRDFKVPLQHLRSVREKLAGFDDHVWASKKLFVLNRRVVWERPDGGGREDIAAGQGVLGEIPLLEVDVALRRDVSQLQTRAPRWVGKIDERRRHPAVIAGSRVPVATIMDLVANGFTDQQIVAEFPTLDPADVAAVRSRSKAA